MLRHLILQSGFELTLPIESVIPFRLTYLCTSPNLYIETLSPDMTVFRARAFEEVRKVK